MRRALEAAENGEEDEFSDILDWCEIGLEMCRDKRADETDGPQCSRVRDQTNRRSASRTRLVSSRVETEIREIIAQREQAGASAG